jgi:hypothetical protein
MGMEVAQQGLMTGIYFAFIVRGDVSSKDIVEKKF